MICMNEKKKTFQNATFEKQINVYLCHLHMHVGQFFIQFLKKVLNIVIMENELFLHLANQSEQ